MSDADTATRCAIGEKPEFSRDAYLAACRAKGASTQVDRAELLSIPRRSLLRLEGNKVTPRVAIMRRVANTLNLTVDELWPAA